jgi:hypothetical protein
MRAFGESEKAIVPDLHLLQLPVRWHLHRLLGVLLNVLNVYGLNLFDHVRGRR